MERIEQLLGSAKYKLAVDTDFNYKLNFESNVKPLKDNLNKIISVLSQESVAREERLVSTKYRFLGRLNVITDNTININNNGVVTPRSEDWSPMFYGGNQNTPPTHPYNWVLQILYPHSIDKYSSVQTNQAYRGITVNNGYNKNISGTKPQIYLETLQKHGLEEDDFFYLYSITSNSNYTGIQQVEFLGDNGEKVDNIIRLKAKYKTPLTDLLILKKVIGPSDDDKNFINPINMLRITTCDLTGGTTNSNYLKVTTGTLNIFSGVTHKLTESDYVDVRANDNNFILNGTHRVEHIVNRYEFVLDLKLGNTPNIVINNIDVSFRRMDGIPSDYYIRKFSLLSDTSYEVTKATEFGHSIYPDSVNDLFGVANNTWLFNFLNNVETKNLYNHRGGELTQIHIATIKRAGKNPFNWSDVTAHWDFQRRTTSGGVELENISINNPNGVGTIEKKIVGNDEYFGDFVEYNRFELLEKTISKIIHRFGLNVRNTPEEGYYLYPFQQINIRKYSNQIETALFKQKVVGIPGDAEKRPNGDVRWRDVLTPGFIEEGNNGVDYPFLNGCNYIYTNKHIFVRRQNPDETITVFGNKASVKPIIIC